MKRGAVERNYQFSYKASLKGTLQVRKILATGRAIFTPTSLACFH